MKYQKVNKKTKKCVSCGKIFLTANDRYKICGEIQCYKKLRNKIYTKYSKTLKGKMALKRAEIKYHPKKQKRFMDLKIKALKLYGGIPPKCQCCKEENIHFLTIDHIQNDGKFDRETNGSGWTMYKKLSVLPYSPKKYQILCYNCNLARAKFGGVCPHKHYFEETEISSYV